MHEVAGPTRISCSLRLRSSTHAVHRSAIQCRHGAAPTGLPWLQQQTVANVSGRVACRQWGDQGGQQRHVRTQLQVIQTSHNAESLRPAGTQASAACSVVIKTSQSACPAGRGGIRTKARGCGNCALHCGSSKQVQLYVETGWLTKRAQTALLWWRENTWHISSTLWSRRAGGSACSMWHSPKATKQVASLL